MWSNVISPTQSVFTQAELSECEDGDGGTGGSQSPPPTRYKHATALHYDPSDSSYYLYVYGGRSGTFALKDFWQLNLSSGVWKEIKPPRNEASSTSSSSSSDASWPPRLQEHTLVSANNKLYMFGGECHHNSDSSSHVWVWGRNNEKSSESSWEKISFKNETTSPTTEKAVRGSGVGPAVVAPVMRRGHSAVVAEIDGETGPVMIVYGGYRDLKGSVADCWAFNIGSETWTALSVPSSTPSASKPGSFWTNILNYWTVSSSSSSSYTNLIHNNGYYACGKSAESSGPYPPARHNHSAVVHNSKMYVYGGMCDLTELSDFWVFDIESRRWSQIKCLYSPGVLKGHAAVVVGNHMYVFGGEGKGGVRSDDVWRFEFNSESFERLSFPGCRPCPRVFATASKLPLRRRVHSSSSVPTAASTPTTDSQIMLTSSSSASSSTAATRGTGQAGTGPTTTTFRKSTSVVRFADTQHLVTYSDSPTCSDYSSMETINYVENPNYRHNRNGSSSAESFEMRQIGGGGIAVQQQQQQQQQQQRNLHRVADAVAQHPEYVLLIGGLETHKSAVFSKQDLVVWRLRVDCCCHGDYSPSAPYRDDSDNDYAGGGHHNPQHIDSFAHTPIDSNRGFGGERNFEVEF